MPDFRGVPSGSSGPQLNTQVRHANLWLRARPYHSPGASLLVPQHIRCQVQVGQSYKLVIPTCQDSDTLSLRGVDGCQECIEVWTTSGVY